MQEERPEALTGPARSSAAAGGYARFGDRVRRWASAEAFLGAAPESWEPGVHVVDRGPLGHLDLLVGGRPWALGARRALPVFLSGAVSTRDGAHGPFFSGAGLAREVGTPFIAVSDPTLRLDAGLDLGWYTGPLGGGLQAFVGDLLGGLAARLERRLLLVGGSGAGFAALDLLDRLEGSASALVWNPQTDLLDYSPAAVERYLVALTGRSRGEVRAMGREERSEVLRSGGIRHEVRTPLPEGRGPARLLYLQNEGDNHLLEQAVPWFEAVGLEDHGGGWWHDGKGRVALVAPFSEDHDPLPRPVLRTALTSLLDVRCRASEVGRELRRSTARRVAQERAPRPLGVLLVGSCVSRDTFAFFHPDDVRLVGYVARQGLASAFSPTVEPVIEPQRLASRFQQRMLVDDAGSSVPELLREVAGEVDLLVWDLVDERLGLHRHADGGLSTDSVEIRGVLGNVLPDHVTRVAFGTVEHLELFTQALQHWRGLLEEVGLLDRLVLLAPRWARETSDGGPVPDSFGLGPLEADALTGPYVDRARAVLGVPVVGRDGEPPRAGTDHQWGAAPFHYDDATYKRLATDLVRQARGLLGEAVLPHGARVPTAAERAPRRTTTAASVRVSSDGEEIVVELAARDVRAWSAHLYRDGGRVEVTGWERSPVVRLAAPGPGEYRVRCHVLSRAGDRRTLTSERLLVT